jgi:hypothetical protein
MRPDKLQESRNRNCRAFVSFWRLSDAPASLFHICRWSAARAPDRCVICHTRHADAPRPRRVQAGHSNCFQPGGRAAARRYRYKPADGSGPGCLVGRAQGATPAGARSDGAARPAAARGRRSSACNGHQDRTQEDQDRKASRPSAGGGVSPAVSALPLDLVVRSPFRFADDGDSIKKHSNLTAYKTLMVRRRPCAVSNHEGHVACFRASSFETLARASSSQDEGISRL